MFCPRGRQMDRSRIHLPAGGDRILMARFGCAQNRVGLGEVSGVGEYVFWPARFRQKATRLQDVTVQVACVSLHT